MTLTLNLTPEIEVALAAKARESGTSPESVALDCLRDQLIQSPPTLDSGEGSMANRWRDHLGVLSSRGLLPEGESLSENTGMKFADLLAEDYRRQGK